MTAPDRSADLSGCQARIDWAEQGLSDLNELARQHALVFESDDDGERGALLLVQMRLLFSNLVHQLRSVLDNLVWELVIAHGKQPHRQAFPISLEGSVEHDQRLVDVLPEHAAVIDGCQPWKWSTPDEHPLAQLHKLWNADKHRVLALVTTKPAVLHVEGIPAMTAGTLALEDGRPVIPLLRRAIGCVDAVVKTFVPALAGQPTALRLSEANVAVWAESFRLRDPSATYIDDLGAIRRYMDNVDLATASHPQLVHGLLLVQRLRISSAFGDDAWPTMIEKALSLRLAQVRAGG